MSKRIKTNDDNDEGNNSTYHRSTVRSQRKKKSKTKTKKI